MVVKDKRGRHRYILFAIEGIERRDIVEAIKNFTPKIQLVFYDGKYGIVKCKHLAKDKVIDFLNSIKIKGSKIKTLKTSGTIKKLKKNLVSFGKPKPGCGFFLAYGTFFIALLFRQWST